MHKAQLGDRVGVQYFRISEQGVANGKRPGRKECEFTVGGSEVFYTLSLGVVGMTPGDRKRLTLQPKEAYGKVRRRLIRQIPRARFPKHLVLQVGKQLRIVGRRRRVTIVEIRLDSVVVDGNHPLAGKVIELEVMLIYLISLGSSPNAQSVASHLSAAP
jgi:FKBP-type peptidyl-prolyl cis-trans isomerase 2